MLICVAIAVLLSGEESKEGVDGEAVVLIEVAPAGVPRLLISTLTSNSVLPPAPADDVEELSDGDGETPSMPPCCLLWGDGVACCNPPGIIMLLLLLIILLPIILLLPMVCIGVLVGPPMDEFRDMLIEESDRFMSPSSVPVDTADGAGDGSIDSLLGTADGAGDGSTSDTAGEELLMELATLPGVR
jgi:hypothetical protein